MSKYFDFDILNRLSDSARSEQKWANGKYFDFQSLNDKQDYLNEWFLLFILIGLFYIWIKLFMAYDRGDFTAVEAPAPVKNKRSRRKK